MNNFLAYEKSDAMAFLGACRKQTTANHQIALKHLAI